MTPKSLFQPLETNHITPEISETTTTNTPVQGTLYSGLFQMIYLTSTTSLKIPPSGKEYLCFQNDGKYSHEAQCEK